MSGEGHAQGGPKGLPVAVFGFDIAEAAQIRRIRSLIALGCRRCAARQ